MRRILVLGIADVYRKSLVSELVRQRTFLATFREKDFTGAGTQMIRCGVLLPVSVNVKVGGLRYLVSPLVERVKLASRFENPVRELGS